MATPDEVVRVKTEEYGAWTAVAGRSDIPDGSGARAAPARPGPVVDGAAARGAAVDLPPVRWTPVRTPRPAKTTAMDTAPIVRVRRYPDRPTACSRSAPGSGSAWT
jgi:hypothetical protein